MLTVLPKASSEAKTKIYLELADYYKVISPDSALYFVKNAENLARKQKDTSSIAYAYNIYGSIQYVKGDLLTAIKLYTEAYGYSYIVKDSTRMANLYNNIGVMYRKLGQYDSSLHYYIQSLKLKEAIGNKKDIVSTINNIGALYYSQKIYDKALAYYQKAEKMAHEMGDTTVIAATYNNFGLIYFEQKKYDLSLNNYNKAKQLWEKKGNIQGLASILNNTAQIHEQRKEWDAALSNYQEAANLYAGIGDLLNQANSQSNAANIYNTTGKYDLAIEHFTIALKIADSLRNYPQLKETYFQLSRCYKNMGKDADAYEYLLKYIAYNDSLYNEQILQATADMEGKYAAEKQTTEIELLKKQKKIQELDNLNQGSELKKQRIIIFSTIMALIAVTIIVILLYNRFRTKRIAALRMQVQRDQLIQKNKEILDSIKYAKRIQEAILPNDYKVGQYLSNSFVLFKPKDIVSGDFYWVELLGIDKVKKPTDKKLIHSPIIVFATVDCTGHGVPGAFMSLLGFNALNQAVNVEWLSEPGTILNYIDKSMTETFQQNNDAETIKDGMDMSLCTLDYTNNLLQFAGANNPLWIISKRKSSTRYILKNNERTTIEPRVSDNGLHLYEIKGNAVAIGTALKRKQIFDNYLIELHEGDVLYIFTDGYADQFGGKENKKYMYNRLRNKLISISQMRLDEQKAELEAEFENWKGLHQEQIDDVCLIGVKI